MKSIFSVAALATGLSLAHAGDITGTVTLKGTPPPEIKNAQIMNDATCGKMHSEMPTTHHWLVGPNGGLANVVVMLKGVPASSGASAAPAVLDQKGCEYVPQILAVQVGQKILVKNSDPVMHNVNIQPTVAGNPPANHAQMEHAPDLTISFDKPENFIKFKCDVHPWMFAWVTIVDNPYFAVTDKDGKFTIKNVPPGEYTIAAFHRKAAPDGMEQKVNVTADGGKADFTMDVK